MSVGRWRDGGRSDRTLIYVTRLFRDWTLKNNEKALNEALKLSVERFEIDPTDVKFCLSAAFLYIEKRDYASAAGMLEAAARFKRFLKKCDVKSLLVYYFLTSAIEYQKGDKRAARKYFDLIMKYEPDFPAFTHLLIAGLRYKSGSAAKALRSYEKSYELGERGAYLYLGLYRAFKSEAKVEGKRLIVTRFLNWLAGKDADANWFLELYEKNADPSDNLFVCKRLYGLYKEEWLLNAIVKRFMSDSNYSKEAFAYYSEARRGRMSSQSLNDAYVTAACGSDAQNVNRRSIEAFIARNEGKIDINTRLFLLSSLLCADNAEGFESDVAVTALYCLKNGVSGRRVNDVYAGFLTVPAEKTGEDVKPDSYVEIEKMVREQLFSYELLVSNPFVLGVWVVEDWKNDAVFYAVTKGKTTIKAAMEGIRLIFLDKTGRVANSGYTLEKLTRNVSVTLLERFYRAGDNDPNLCAALAERYIWSEKGDLDLAEGVLNKIMKLDGVNERFRERALAALAGVLYRRSEYGAALEIYKKTDADDIKGASAKRALFLLLDAGDYAAAAAVLAKTREKIEERALFHAVKQIIKNGRAARVVAEAARRLLINGWRAEELTDAAVNYYNATGDELRELADATLDEPSAELDKKIVARSTFTRRFDAGAQKAFRRLFALAVSEGADKETQGAVGEFAAYCCYEMIINGEKPEYDTLAALEKICVSSGERVISYALCETYVTHDLRTVNSDAVMDIALRAAEQDGLILPSFKKSKDKKFMIPYIIKNTPFIYKRDANVDVKLRFKTDDAEEFTEVNMRYFRFGLYYAVAPHFYGEKLTYYFVEKTSAGSVETKRYSVKNDEARLSETSDDMFFAVNNALIYYSTFKYALAEKEIERAVLNAGGDAGELLL